MRRWLSVSPLLYSNESWDAIFFCISFTWCTHFCLFLSVIRILNYKLDTKWHWVVKLPSIATTPRKQDRWWWQEAMKWILLPFVFWVLSLFLACMSRCQHLMTSCFIIWFCCPLLSCKMDSYDADGLMDIFFDSKYGLRVCYSKKGWRLDGDGRSWRAGKKFILL